MRLRVGIRLLTWGIVAALALGLGVGLDACRIANSPAALSPTPPRSMPSRTRATAVLGTTSGPVAVMVEKSSYAPDDTLVASIHNGLAKPIFARDERSDCTVMDLERWVNSSWQIQAPCVNMQPAPHVVQVALDAVLTQQLAPGLSDATVGSWSAGTYRIAFAYVTSADQPFGQSTVIYSASFTIG
jgi:hypothetical protein